VAPYLGAVMREKPLLDIAGLSVSYGPVAARSGRVVLEGPSEDIEGRMKEAYLGA
jgi:hypothetical protein